MHCPKCSHPTLKAQVVPKRSTTVDRCTRCNGIWFDGKELQAVLNNAAKDLRVADDAEESYRICPVCKKSLYRFQYPQTLVMIEMCKRCQGLWLDHGEFKEIKAVRSALKKSGELDEYAPVTGFKGALIRFIEDTINS